MVKLLYCTVYYWRDEEGSWNAPLKSGHYSYLENSYLPSPRLTLPRYSPPAKTLTGDPYPEPEIGEKPTVHSTSPNIFGIILRSPCHSLRRYGLLFSCRKIALSLFSSDLWESARILHIVIAEAKNKG